MNFIELIRKKREGQRLTKNDIDYFIDGYVAGRIPDYQVSALLMAICFQNLDEQETSDLTFAMRDSGAQVDLSNITGVKVDKHSTGGVADTTSLIAGPIVASCGVNVAKMSGRGLGHTGGTIDKLEAIPGFSTAIPMARFEQIVRDCHLSIVGQSEELVPADRLLYALRDATATIDNISLIAASIMSKKLASGADGILLDVKTGNGAFMRHLNDAEQLARTMVSIGCRAGKKVQALVTDMNQPLGNAVGNALEVREAIEILRNPLGGDLQDLAVELAARMLILAGLCSDLREARGLAQEKLSTGRALSALREMITAHGGDPKVCDDLSLLPQAEKIAAIPAPAAGYVGEIATVDIGQAALLLGAGRLQKNDPIDLSVGVKLLKRRGDYVTAGESLAEVHCNGADQLQGVAGLITNAFTLKEQKESPKPLIYSTIPE